MVSWHLPWDLKVRSPPIAELPRVPQSLATHLTTFAVRGLLRHLVYTAISRIVGGALIGIAFGVGSLANPNGFWLFVGILVIAVGGVVSAMAALQELKQTEPISISTKGITAPKGYRLS